MTVATKAAKAVVSGTRDNLRISSAGRTTHATVENHSDSHDCMAVQVKLVATKAAKAVLPDTRDILRILHAVRTTHAMAEDPLGSLDCMVAQKRPVTMNEKELTAVKTNC